MMPTLFIMFLICALAETNRHPFDLPEAEAELVSGYNVEYSSISFSLFFLGEYASLIFMSAFVVNFFLGGWDFFFSSYVTNIILIKIFSNVFYFFKIVFFCFLFVYVRGLTPRYRYDQLMRIG
jgi:NADH-quinone oxidoreductase subunit H